MPDSIHSKRFPGESDEYREARNKLLKAEIELRENIENVARLRRGLPMGGKVEQDYLFEEIQNGKINEVAMSALFKDNKDTLIVYSFMYGPNMENPCPACTAIIDGFNGFIHHLEQRVNFAVVAKSPIKRISDFAVSRHWSGLHLLSSEKNSFNSDYFAETENGSQMPMCDVFVKKEDGIYHFWGSELLFAPAEGHPRHMDLMWPIWNFLDLTPGGRGTDWHTKLSYD